MKFLIRKTLKKRSKPWKIYWWTTTWATRYPLRWLALKRLERDPEIGQEWKTSPRSFGKVENKDACCDPGEAVNYELQETVTLPGDELLQTYEAEGWSKDQFRNGLCGRQI